MTKIGTNNYEGETKITLYDKTYPMKVNMRVIAAFQSETGHDYMHCAMRAMNALQEAQGLNPLAQAEVMTKAVPMDVAAWFFFLAGKEADSTVTFEEIQEAVLLEGPLMRLSENPDSEGRESYPVLFTDLVMFATMGAIDTAKK